VIASRNRAAQPRPGRVADGESQDEGQACPGLARALERLLAERDRPEVLDLGQFCRQTAVVLANRGVRVSVADFEAPAPDAEPSAEGAEEVPALAIDQPEERFDLVLAWEHGDFLSPRRLPDFGAEIRRVMAPGGWLLFFAQDVPGAAGARDAQAGSYRLTEEGRIVRVPAGPTRPRWSHTNRNLERVLAPLKVQSVHLQKERIREFLMRKPGGR
jgi:hypothetical protein